MTMTKEETEIEKMKTPTKGKENSEKTEVTKPAAAKAKVVLTKVPINKTYIGTRLDEAIKGAKPVNRSSDLVPLGREFDKMRKQLRLLIVGAKHYHAARAEVEKARMEVTMQLSELAMKSPLHEHVGNAPGLTSLTPVHKLATEKARVGAQQYQKKIINYAIEWEQIVTTRVDEDLKENNKLHVKLNHYENKVDSLRKRVNAVENRGKESPTKLSEKLTRNEDKLKQAWKVHEESASTLCNLLDEITTGGWKDLYPLVMAALQWEVGRVTEEHDAYGKLSEVEKAMTSTFDEKASVPVVEQRAEKPSDDSSPSAAADAAAVTAAGDVDSDTTGSFHPPPDMVSISSSDDGDHDVKAAESPEDGGHDVKAAESPEDGGHGLKAAESPEGGGRDLKAAESPEDVGHDHKAAESPEVH